MASHAGSWRYRLRRYAPPRPGNIGYRKKDSGNKRMIMVTGGAGFIGSAIVWRLNNLGKRDILIVDTPDHPQKEKNLASLTYQRLVSIEDFPQQLRGGEYDSAGVEAIIHQGAISSTVEQDWAR